VSVTCYDTRCAGPREGDIKGRVKVVYDSMRRPITHETAIAVRTEKRFFMGYESAFVPTPSLAQVSQVAAARISAGSPLTVYGADMSLTISFDLSPNHS
jgi:hypothetical protein